MRIRLIFSLLNKGAVLPFHHQGILADFFDQFISTEHGNRLTGDIGFNFSGLKGQTLVTREGLAYTSNMVTIVFSTAHPSIVDRIVELIFSQKRDLLLGGLKLRPHQVLVEEPPQFTQCTKYVMISPFLLVVDGHSSNDIKKFIHPEKRSFHLLLKQNTFKRMMNAGLFQEYDYDNFKFIFKPDLEYLSKIKLSEKKFSRIYQAQIAGKIHEFRGYIFPFTLEADMITHRFIFERGLGNLAHLGYGMTDTVSNIFAARVKPYMPLDSNLMGNLISA